jgi:hypothetical protein
MLSFDVVEEVNQRVKRRKAADSSPVLILDNLLEESRRI